MGSPFPIRLATIPEEDESCPTPTPTWSANPNLSEADNVNLLLSFLGRDNSSKYTHSHHTKEQPTRRVYTELETVEISEVSSVQEEWSTTSLGASSFRDSPISCEELKSHENEEMEHWLKLEELNKSLKLASQGNHQIIARQTLVIRNLSTENDALKSELRKNEALIPERFEVDLAEPDQTLRERTMELQITVEFLENEIALVKSQAEETFKNVRDQLSGMREEIRQLIKAVNRWSGGATIAKKEQYAGQQENKPKETTIPVMETEI